jgi:hypothetical protein
MVRAYQVLIDRLNEAGIFPTEHILDNEKIGRIPGSDKEKQDDVPVGATARPSSE